MRHHSYLIITITFVYNGKWNKIVIFILHISEVQEVKIFTGNSNKALANSIANHLGVGIGRMTVSHFVDGECNVMINENIRGTTCKNGYLFRISYLL